ncbi:MAG TPA: hypothetical protein VIG24_19300 [Acidimicrobiia bacterium]
MNVYDSIPPIAAGGADFLQPGHDKGPWIDTLVDNDVHTPYGRIVLSATTVSHLARLLGWAPPEEVTAVKAENDQLSAELADLRVHAQKNADIVRLIAEVADGLVRD